MDVDETRDLAVAAATLDPDQPPLTPEQQQRLDRVARTRLRSSELFVELRDDLGSEASRSHARDQLVHLHLPLVEHCARRDTSNSPFARPRSRTLR